MLRRLLLAACCVALLAGAAAPREYDEDDLPKTWEELDVAPPPAPLPRSLVEFAVSSASRNRFFIDLDTLRVDRDGVVRYVLVVRSPAGARNVSYEGIRCQSREQKFYAFGQRDGAWVPVRDPQWRPIEYREVNRQHGVLSRDHFCDGGSPRPVATIRQRMRYGAPPEHADS